LVLLLEMTMKTRCAFCPRLGVLRQYRQCTVALCACCAFDVEMKTATPDEIANEVSCAVNAMVAS
jgi:hypothetical protein